jgi:two-component system NtrC family sensor kinase
MATGLASLLPYPGAMQHLNILVVSATRETATWLSGMLTLSGDQVEAVTDGADAFQRVWDVDYDVIVTELGVPGIDGRDLYMAFQNTWPELTRRMVFVCGEPSQALEQFVAQTSVPCVRGPVTLVELREAVRAVCGAPRPRAMV